MSRRKQIELPNLQPPPPVPDGWTTIVRGGLALSIMFLLHEPFDALREELWQHLGDAARARIEGSPLLAWAINILLAACELAFAWWLGVRLEQLLRKFRSQDSN